MKKNRILLGLLLVISFISCEEEQEQPGPISVTNEISPERVEHGQSITWKIKVYNSGAEVKIDRVKVEETIESGWAASDEIYSDDISIEKATIAAHREETIVSLSIPVSNTGTGPVTIKNKVTVYSNGGTSYAIAYYTVNSYKKKYANELQLLVVR
ncbi:MAG TPA: hypothetical protein VJ951_14450 [Bacteroidales bacterium]|nr:hypothetical protein [Bacteroidales bacterium]